MRKLVCMIIICATVFGAAPARAASEADEALKIYVNEAEVEFEDGAFVKDGTAYVSLEEMSMRLCADKILLDEENGRAQVRAEDLVICLDVDSCYMEANGRYLYLPEGCILEGDCVYVPVRQLAAAFGAGIRWDGETQSVYILPGDMPIADGDSYYDEEALYWLSRIIQSEASGEEMRGKIAVGNVVLNRVESPVFPDSVYDVIFDFQYGVQFSPAYSGAIYNTPSDEAVIAAKLAMDGANAIEGSYYFVASYIATSSWVGQNRTFVEQIGNHCFYA